MMMKQIWCNILLVMLPCLALLTLPSNAFLVVTGGKNNFFGDHAFTASQGKVDERPSLSLLTLQLAKRKKLSMAEKRKQRHERSRRVDVTIEKLPPSKLDFKTMNEKKESSEEDVDKNQSSNDVADPNSAAYKAQKLVQAQRDSVDMLTSVRKRVEGLPEEEILTALDGVGYYVVDNFFSRQTKGAENDDLTYVNGNLLEETSNLYSVEEDMEVDASNLGGGEYVTAVVGGDKQYAKCPRTVEFVVSTTRHIPELLQSLNLEAGQCMATLRAFDRKALQASMALLTGSAEANNDDNVDKPFRKVVTDEESDKRRLTLQYYILPESWDESCGGGLIFEGNDNGSSINITPKPDRLVLWNSATTPFKTVPWRGKDGNDFGGCLELHLVEKMVLQK